MERNMQFNIPRAMSVGTDGVQTQQSGESYP